MILIIINKIGIECVIVNEKYPNACILFYNYSSILVSMEHFCSVVRNS